jgi:hypothetical protein
MLSLLPSRGASSTDAATGAGAGAGGLGWSNSPETSLPANGGLKV